MYYTLCIIQRPHYVGLGAGSHVQGLCHSGPSLSTSAGPVSVGFDGIVDCSPYECMQRIPWELPSMLWIANASYAWRKGSL